MKKRVWKGILWFVLGFLLFFTIRIIYGFYTYPPGSTYKEETVYFEGFRLGFRNYASEKGYYKGSGKSSGSSRTRMASVDQKYEKVATVQIKSDEFTHDEQQIRALVKKQNGLIQFERSAGNPGERKLQLAIGIDPALFDNVVEEIKGIGELHKIQVNKSDKTNEYKTLEARKRTLENSQQFLAALKDSTGPIEEMIQLENRILDLEEQKQALGVDLGDYDEENEFCTIKFSLAEGGTAKPITWVHRVKKALEWTIKYYGLFMLIIVMVVVSAFCIVMIYDKVSKQWKTKNDSDRIELNL